MPDPTLWEKTKTNSKAGFDKAWKALDKLGAPVNRLSNKLGSEAFWPTTLDKECDKAARILKSFCKDGFYAEEPERVVEGVPKGKQRVIKKIPKEVIQNAKGLCIFTTMRTGLWVSGSGGSGVLVARLPSGEWSPPSGILMHTAGLGFLVGVDIYDCVIVINNEKALEAFTKVRCTVGGEMTVAAGPVGVGGMMDSEVHKRQAAIFTYIKSRGFYAGVQIDGTVVIERFDENERFYNQKLPATDILKGKVRHAPYDTKTLMATLRAAEGQFVDDELLPEGPPPGDYEIEDDGHVFGIPDKEDPDPYGVLALEKEGMGVREAGTRDAPSYEEFTFNPSPSSPLQGVMKRRSLDSKEGSKRSSWRTSGMSTTSKVADTVTQTDEGETAPNSPRGMSVADRLSRRSGSPASSIGQLNGIRESVAESRSDGPSPAPPPLPPRQTVVEEPKPQAAQSDDDDADEDDNEEPAVFGQVQTTSLPIASAGAVQITKPRLVTVHKVAPPKLPPRSTARDRREVDEPSASAAEAQGLTAASSPSMSERKTEDGSEADAQPESLSSVSELRTSLDGVAEKTTGASVGEAKSNGHVQPPTLPARSADGFQEVDLIKPDPVSQHITAEEKEAKRLSTEAVQSLTAQMRLDAESDDDTDDSTARRAGRW